MVSLMTLSAGQLKSATSIHFQKQSKFPGNMQAGHEVAQQENTPQSDTWEESRFAAGASGRSRPELYIQALFRSTKSSAQSAALLSGWPSL
jgi:hypothetical protein